MNKLYEIVMRIELLSTLTTIIETRKLRKLSTLCAFIYFNKNSWS